MITSTLSTPIALAPSNRPLAAFTFLSLQVICGSTSKSSSFLTLQASKQLSILALAIGLSAIVTISAPADFNLAALSINLAIFVSIGESSSTAIGFCPDISFCSNLFNLIFCEIFFSFFTDFLGFISIPLILFFKSSICFGVVPQHPPTTFTPISRISSI